jgi:hypothetical protein
LNDLHVEEVGQFAKLGSDVTDPDRAMMSRALGIPIFDE